MGILVITWNFPPHKGGIEKLIAGLCKELRKNHPLFVITSYADSDEAREDWIFRPRWPGLLAFSLYALSRGAVLLRRNPDVRVIIGGSAMVTPLVLILARSFRRKAIINVHGLDLIYPSILYQTLCARWIKNCDGVIANSEFTASLARAKKTRESSIRVIPPGVSCDDHPLFQGAQVKNELGFEGRKVLLYVGRLTRRKGVKEFVQHCLPNIMAEVPEVVFLIVGGNPSESLVHRDDIVGELKALVRDLNLESHVRLIGWLSNADLARVYQAADLLIVPALSLKDDVEGFGIVILEAAAAGIPAVATRVGGIPDAIEDGKSGILVEPGDYGQMSYVLADLLRNDSTRRDLGRYARKRAAEHHSWETITAKYKKAFRDLSTPESKSQIENPLS